MGVALFYVTYDILKDGDKYPVEYGLAHSLKTQHLPEFADLKIQSLQVFGDSPVEGISSLTA